MDVSTLLAAMAPTQLTQERAAALLPHFEGAMRAAGITNVNRAAMWCAQIGHESAGLRYMEEIADGSAYNGRADLGNIYPGDGPRFKGSGPIQLTGRHNFRAFTRWARAEGHTDHDFEAAPHLVREDPRWGFLAASWYWTQARPQLNRLADAGDLIGATRAINGGTNGLDDRRARWERCLRLGDRLLPGGTPTPSKGAHEALMNYSRDRVTQLTPWNCGPASTETAIQAATGKWVDETQLARELKTHRGGTDWIGQFPAVLNRHIPGADYRVQEMPNDPPTHEQKERLWDHLKASIAAGHPVILNIVSPPNNRPRAVAPSAINLAYPPGGDVYHYVAAIAVAGEGAGRRVWWADSGFAPFGSWISFDQTATLIPPKGYAWSAAPPLSVAAAAAPPTELEVIMSAEVPSYVNPNKKFPAPVALGLIDRQGWENRRLLEATLDALRTLFVALDLPADGLDAEKIIAEAIAKEME